MLRAHVILMNVSSCRSALVIPSHLDFLVIGVVCCTLFIKRRDGMGSVEDYIIKYDVPRAEGLKYYFNHFSRREHAVCHFTALTDHCQLNL